MQYRRLGKSGTSVSAVSLGGWINFSKDAIDKSEARSIIKTSYENGVNFYDVADVYGHGEVEEQVGTLLSDFPRHTLVISSKVFATMSDDVNDRGLSRKHIMESIDKSLQRLGTDYLDIYFCHRADPDTPLLETARAMDDLVRQGKIHYWGTSMWEPEQLREVYSVCDIYNLHSPQVEQPEYSLLNHQRLEEEILPITEKFGMGITVFSPLAMGVLTGKYDGGVPDNSRLATTDWVKDSDLFSEDNIERVRQLKPIADDLKLSRAQLALAWALRQPGLSSVITGASKPSHIEESVKAAEVTLSDDVLKQIDEILS